LIHQIREGIKVSKQARRHAEEKLPGDVDIQQEQANLLRDQQAATEASTAEQERQTKYMKEHGEASQLALDRSLMYSRYNDPSYDTAMLQYELKLKTEREKEIHREFREGRKLLWDEFIGMPTGMPGEFTQRMYDLVMPLVTANAPRSGQAIIGEGDTAKKVNVAVPEVIINSAYQQKLDVAFHQIFDMTRRLSEKASPEEMVKAYQWAGRLFQESYGKLLYETEGGQIGMYPGFEGYMNHVIWSEMKTLNALLAQDPDAARLLGVQTVQVPEQLAVP